MDEEDREDVGQDPGAGVEQEVGTQHGGDGTAGPCSGTRAAAAVLNSRVIAVCVSIAANPPAK